MLQINKAGLKWGLRLSILSICLFTIASIFAYSTKLNQNNYRLLYSQSEQISRIVVRQAAKMAYESMLIEDSKTLEQLISNLENEEYIFDATIYDQDGNFLYGSENALVLSELTGLNNPVSIASIGRHQLVEPIAQNGKYVGFLRITLEHGKIIQLASNGINKNINFAQTLLIIALFTGAIFVLILARKIEFWILPVVPK